MFKSPQAFLKQNIFRILIIVILILSAKLLLFNINKPFWGHHDWNSVVYSNIARNYVRYGYIKTKFGQVTSYDNQSGNKFGFITHYPPLLPIIISISFKLAGQSEASARLPIVLFSLLMIYLIFQIGKEIHSKLLGVFAAASTMFLPIFIYFGKLPVHDTVVPSISMFGFWVYIKYIKENNSKYYYFLILSLIIGGFVNWSAFYLAAVLICHQFIYKTTNDIKYKIFGLFPISVTIFLAYLVHIKILGQKSTSAFSNLMERVNPFLTSNLYGYTPLKYVIQELRYIKIYYTLPVILGAIFFIFLSIYYFKKDKLSFDKSFIFILFLYGIIQLLVFQQLSFIHDYMIYYLLPFLVLSFSYSIFFIFNSLKKRLIFPLILIVLLSIILFNQFKYTQTLLATNINKRGYEVAKVINSNTSPGQTSFITSNSYKEFQEVFIGYYSDRVVSYGEELPPNFDKTFTLIARPKDHDPLPVESKKLLDKTYQKYENDEYIWYKIN